MTHNPTLNAADSAFAAQIGATLGKDVLRPLTEAYLQEPRGRFFGSDGVLVAPRTVEEVSTLIRMAQDARVGVVPYGGGTGLVGGQVKPDGPAPLILSLERMQAVRAVYPDENVIIAEAGAILADVQDAAAQANRLFPLSLAAQGSARIGGNLATNAGGVNVLRYGNARDLCLGLEAVLPDGQIWHGLSRLRKDNTGYDLRNLLVGSEGTLGVITAAALKLSPIPAGQGCALLVVPSPRAALDLLGLVRDHMGEDISAFELIHRQGLDFLQETMPELHQPFTTPPEWSVLIDLGLPKGLDPVAVLGTIFERAFSAGLVEDGVIASSQTQRAALWSVREHIPEGNKRIGSISSHDIALPLGAIPDFIAQAPGHLAALGDFRINCFGHLGDGNLHYNVFPTKGRSRDDYPGMSIKVKACVHDLVVSFGGSISAEHGIGRAKAGDLAQYGDPVKLAAMQALKSALDPNGIMNPGAVLGQS